MKKPVKTKKTEITIKRQKPALCAEPRVQLFIEGLEYSVICQHHLCTGTALTYYCTARAKHIVTAEDEGTYPNPDFSNF